MNDGYNDDGYGYSDDGENVMNDDVRKKLAEHRLSSKDLKIVKAHGGGAHVVGVAKNELKASGSEMGSLDPLEKRVLKNITTRAKGVLKGGESVGDDEWAKHALDPRNMREHEGYAMGGEDDTLPHGVKDWTHHESVVKDLQRKFGYEPE